MLITFFQPIGGVLLAVGLFITFDTIMAMWRSRMKGVEITSKKARKMLPKLLSYNMLVITFWIMDKFIINDIMLIFFSVNYILTKILAMVLIFIEVKSIDESWKIVKGKSLFTSLQEMIGFIKKTKSDINLDK
jgi:uncharacterized membrane protein YqjE